MKYFAIIAAIVAFSQLVSAQSPTCAAQEVLTTCLSNQDIYLKTCIGQDYACLCKWHTTKLSCYDNCPQSLGRASQQGLKDTFCSIAQTYNTTTLNNSVLSSITAPTLLPSNTPSAALPSITSHNTTSTSSAVSGKLFGQGVFALVAGLTSTYFCL